MISLWVFVVASAIGLPVLASIIGGDFKGFKLRFEDEKDPNLQPFRIGEEDASK
jgi:hypothetical protein